VTEFTARVPSALAAFLSVILTFLLARRMMGDHVGFWSGVVLSTTVVFWWEARTVHTDMLMVFGLTLAMLALWLWHTERKGHWLVVFYAAICVALFAKGPPALAFPLLALFSFYWGRKAERRQTHWLLGLTVAVVVVLLWYIPARMSLPKAPTEGAGGGSVFNELYRQSIGRAVLGSSKAQPPWYYIENLPMTLFPWVLLLPWTVLWCKRHWKDSVETRYLLSWSVPAFIFFSIVIGKRPYYLLPIYPAVAILTARSVLDLVEDNTGKWIRWTAVAWAVVLGLFAATPFLLRFTAYGDVNTSSLMIVCVLAVGFALNTLFQVFKKKNRAIHMLIATQFGGLLVLAAVIVFPMIDPYKSARGLCEPLAKLSLAKQEYALYSVGLSREEYIFYARHFHEPVLTDSLDMPEDATAAEEKKAKELQFKTRAAIVKAVSEKQVPIASFARVTPEEVQALNTQLDAAVKLVQLDPQLAADFEAALKKEVDAFVERFERPTPSFMFVQERDWRWLLPLRPELREYVVLGNQSVGRRDMLLIANAEGARLAGLAP